MHEAAIGWLWIGVLGASPAPTTGGASATTISSVWDFAVKGGIIMIPIAICSLIGLALTVERMLTLRRQRVIPDGFSAGLRDLVKGGAPQPRVLEYCRARPSPFARICEAGLKNWERPREQLEKSVGDAGLREVAGLRKYLRGLSVIASIAPLLGLLGTIFGMIKAFQTVAASGEALGRTELLAEGIYEAMITTAAGLIVAIPALVAYHYLAARVDRLVLDMDAECMALLEEHGAAPSERVVVPPMPAPVVATASLNGTHEPAPAVGV